MATQRKRTPFSTEDRDAKLTAMIAAASAGAPPQLSKIIIQCAPVIKALATAINVVGPLYMQLFHFLYAAYEYLPVLLLQALCGLAMCFFGGAYQASLAAAEAFAMTGWETTRSALNDVYGNVVEIAKANDADDKKDDDGDGVADVSQIPASQLLERKLRLTAMAIKDPQKLTEAVGGLYAGWVAVQGTLRLQFAKTITLGVSIANMLEGPALRHGVPVLIHVIPPEYRHWVPTLIRSFCKAVAVSVAWYLQTIISAFHSAMRGGLLFSRSIMAWAVASGYIATKEDDSRLDELVGYSVAALGFWTQWAWGFGLPFPFNIVMLPFTLLEWYIRWSVTTDM